MIDPIVVLLDIFIFLTIFLGVLLVYKHSHFTKLAYHYETQAKAIHAQLNSLADQLLTLKSQHDSNIRAAREDAVSKSRSVIRGQATEHMAPMLMGGFNIRDFRFIGDPIDYLCIDGLSDLLDGVNEEDSVTIYLLDIKSGKASLSKVQRRIRDAVVAGRVKFASFNPDTQSYREWPEPVISPPLPVGDIILTGNIPIEEDIEIFDLMPDLEFEEASQLGPLLDDPMPGFGVEKIIYSGPAIVQIPQDTLNGNPNPKDDREHNTR